MIRGRLSTFAIVASLLICVAVVTLWVRSYSKADDLWYSAGDQLLFIESARGTFVVGWDSNEGGYARFAWVVMDAHEFDNTQQHSLVGFGITYENQTGMVLRHISVPDWSIVLMNAGLLLYVLKRRGRKFSLHCCTNCRYNLTANTSGVCPECGTAVAAKAETIT